MNLKSITEAALPDWFTKHPLTQAIMNERAAEVLKTRQAAAEQIEAIKTEQAEVIPKLHADLDAKEAKFLKAKASFEEAARSFQAAKAALSAENSNYSNSISRQEQVLTESADPAIDDAIQFFRAKLDWLRSPGRIVHNAIGSETDIITEKTTTRSESNIHAIHDALDFCRAAIRALELMKLEPAFFSEKIEAMKKAIPDINVFTESTGERPMEGSKGITFESQFKSDSQLDWEMSRLLEKADKVLSKRAKK